MTIQLAKDQAAQKHGYTDFDEFMYLGVTGDAMDDINAIYETAMERYAEAKAKEFAEWLHEHWNAKHGGWSAKTGDINTVYSAEALYKSFIAITTLIKWNT